MLLFGLPTVLTTVATATLDARTFFIIQSRNVKRHKKSQDPKLLQNCVSRTSAATNRNLTIPLNSTVISTALSIICNVMIVVANVSTIHSFYVVINSVIVVNSFRVPMIISFAFKANNSTVCRSRVKRQEWERQNALQEKQKRIQAIHDSHETQDTQETQNAGASMFNLESSENSEKDLEMKDMNPLECPPGKKSA